jgi:hypothetical protein
MSLWPCHTGWGFGTQVTATVTLQPLHERLVDPSGLAVFTADAPLTAWPTVYRSTSDIDAANCYVYLVPSTAADDEVCASAFSGHTRVVCSPWCLVSGTVFDVLMHVTALRCCVAAADAGSRGGHERQHDGHAAGVGLAQQRRHVARRRRAAAFHQSGVSFPRHYHCRFVSVLVSVVVVVIVAAGFVVVVQ